MISVTCFYLANIAGIRIQWVSTVGEEMSRLNSNPIARFDD